MWWWSAGFCPHERQVYSPPFVDKNYGVWGSYYGFGDPIYFLLEGDCRALRGASSFERALDLGLCLRAITPGSTAA